MRDDPPGGRVGLDLAMEQIRHSMKWRDPLPPLILVVLGCLLGAELSPPSQVTGSNPDWSKRRNVVG